MNGKKKLALMFASAALVVSTALFGTLAYLTSQHEVTNTFTVGKVDITVDEAAVVDGNLTKTEGGTITMEDYLKAKNDTTSTVPEVKRTTDGNEYKLIPGKTYVKDPTLTIKGDSEPAYVRMKVTITEYDKWNEIYAAHGKSANLQEIFGGYDADIWVCKSEKVVTSPSSITYEFRYMQKDGVVEPVNGQDTVLPALFTTFTVPTFLNGDELLSIQNMEIRVVGEAIQKEGFEAVNDNGTVTPADEVAWSAFDEQMNPSSTS